LAIWHVELPDNVCIDCVEDTLGANYISGSLYKMSMTSESSSTAVAWCIFVY